MTILPDGNSDTSTQRTTLELPGGRSPRLFTEPLREICALALLGANAIFLILGVTGLLFVIDGWAGEFGLRSARTYDSFAGGLIPVGFPVLAVLLATHVRPIAGRARLITLVALVEYGVSALFGAVTFLGAFAHDLSSVRATLEGVLARVTWASLLVIAGVLVLRIWLGSIYLPRPQVYRHRPGYDQPYPGQPMYPNPGYPLGGPPAAAPSARLSPQLVVPPAVTVLPPTTLPVSATLPPATLAPPTPRSAMPPSAMPPSAMPPSAMPPSAMPPSAMPPFALAAPAVPPPAVSAPVPAEQETNASGWPAVPPPPMPAPPAVEPASTERSDSPSTAELPTQRLGG